MGTNQSIPGWFVTTLASCDNFDWTISQPYRTSKFQVLSQPRENRTVWQSECNMLDYSRHLEFKMDAILDPFWNAKSQRNTSTFMYIHLSFHESWQQITPNTKHQFFQKARQGVVNNISETSLQTPKSSSQTAVSIVFWNHHPYSPGLFVHDFAMYHLLNQLEFRPTFFNQNVPCIGNCTDWDCVPDNVVLGGSQIILMSGSLKEVDMWGYFYSISETEHWGCLSNWKPYHVDFHIHPIARNALI